MTATSRLPKQRVTTRRSESKAGTRVVLHLLDGREEYTEITREELHNIFCSVVDGIEREFEPTGETNWEGVAICFEIPLRDADESRRR